MPRLTSGKAKRFEGVISTLGPRGTDSACEAEKYSPNVLLFPTFAEAIDHAESTGGYALVPTGYLDVREGALADAWVDMHFRLLGRMRIVDLWESATKPMCLAINTRRVADRDAIRSVALHPATSSFARQACGDAEMMFFNSKPMAVEAAASGKCDACIGSVDMVTDAALKPIDYFYPTMVWTLYQSAQERAVADSGSDTTVYRSYLATADRQ